MLGGSQRKVRAALPVALADSAEVKHMDAVALLPETGNEVLAVKIRKATEVEQNNVDDADSESTVGDAGDEVSELSGELAEETCPAMHSDLDGPSCKVRGSETPLALKPASPEMVCQDRLVFAAPDQLQKKEQVDESAVTEASEDCQLDQTSKKEWQLATVEPQKNRVAELASDPSFQAAALGGAGGAVALGASGAAGGSLVGAAVGVVSAPLTLGLSIPVCSVLGGSAGGMVGGTAGLIGGSAAGSKAYEHREAIKESFIAFSNRDDVKEGLARVQSGQELVKESLKAFANREDVQAGLERAHAGQEQVKESLRALVNREDVQAGIARAYSSQELVKESLMALAKVDNPGTENQGALVRVRRRDILAGRIRQSAENLKSLVRGLGNSSR